MKFETVRHLVALLSIALLMSGIVPVQAQTQQSITAREVPQDGHPQIAVIKDPVRQTYVATVKNDRGAATVPIIKDPNAAEVLNSRQKEVKKWSEVKELGHSPWGKPAKSMAEIAKDPNVRKYIGTKTTLEPAQQEALNKGLDHPEKWIEVKASELPILEAFWGLDWQRYKVSMNLKEEFKNTKAYLYFAAETLDWYVFYAYCRNLGQPFSGFTWTAKVEEVIVSPPPEEVKPKVRTPKCIKLVSKDGGTGPIMGAQQRTYIATFYNPDGVDVNLTYVLQDKKSGEIKTRYSGSEFTVTGTWLTPGAYVVGVAAKTDTQAVDTTTCVAELAIALPPAKKVVVEEPPKGGHTGVYVGVGAAVVLAAILLAVLLRGKKLQKTPVSVCKGDPACLAP